MTGTVVDTSKQAQDKLDRALKQLQAYRECINKIDDYLERQRESEKDAIWILAMIDKLTGTLRAIGG